MSIKSPAEIKEISFIKKESGYRYSVDPFLLADFVETEGMAKGVDMGTGNGIIAILLAALNPQLSMVGIEIQEGLAGEADKNVALNGLEERVKIIHSDIKDCRKLLGGATFDFVAGNPPYRRGDDGKINRDGEEAIACHEIKITLKDYLKACARLAHDKGKVSIIYHPYRLTDLMAEMREAKLRPSKIRFVHSNPDSEASMVMVEAIKGGNNDLVVLPPLYIYDIHGKYTEGMVKMYARFGFEAVK